MKWDRSEVEWIRNRVRALFDEDDVSLCSKIENGRLWKAVREVLAYDTQEK